MKVVVVEIQQKAVVGKTNRICSRPPVGDVEMEVSWLGPRLPVCEWNGCLGLRWGTLQTVRCLGTRGMVSLVLTVFSVL